MVMGRRSCGRYGAASATGPSLFLEIVVQFVFGGFFGNLSGNFFGQDGDGSALLRMLQPVPQGLYGQVPLNSDGQFLQLLLPCANMLSLGGGGGMCILFEICKKRPFQKCMGSGRGGGGLPFFSVAQHIGRCTQTWHCTVHPFLFRITVIVSIFQAGLGPHSGRHPPVCGQGHISSIFADPATSVPSLAPNLC